MQIYSRAKPSLLACHSHLNVKLPVSGTVHVVYLAIILVAELLLLCTQYWPITGFSMILAVILACESLGLLPSPTHKCLNSHSISEYLLQALETAGQYTVSIALGTGTKTRIEQKCSSVLGSQCQRQANQSRLATCYNAMLLGKRTRSKSQGKQM